MFQQLTEPYHYKYAIAFDILPVINMDDNVAASSLQWDMLDLADHLRQERLFVSSEQQHLQELNAKVNVHVCLSSTISIILLLLHAINLLFLSCLTRLSQFRHVWHEWLGSWCSKEQT